LPEYRGNLKAFVDETCNTFNKTWEEDQDKIKQTIQQFDEAVEITIKVFGENNFARIWLNDKNKYERQRNLSVLDTLLFYFSDTVIRERVNQIDKTNIEQAFKNLCSSSTNFISSVKSSTNNMANTHRRLSLWGKALREVLEIDFNIPELVNNRLIFSGFRIGRKD
jgi:hypothetical protein